MYYIQELSKLISLGCNKEILSWSEKSNVILTFSKLSLFHKNNYSTLIYR
jgi:hypothetical protein